MENTSSFNVDPMNIPLPTTPTNQGPPIPDQVALLYQMFENQNSQLAFLQQLLMEKNSIRGPKLALPSKFDGQAENFDSFWMDVSDYLREKKYEYVQDSSKITFVASLLEGNAKLWMDALRMRARSEIVEELQSFNLFSEAFEGHFMNRHQRQLAENELRKLSRGTTPLPEHLAKAERLAIRAGFNIKSDLGIQMILATLDPDTRWIVRDQIIIQPDLAASYERLKNFLIEYDTNE